MKIRNGFVSNSSSSSFICEICNSAHETFDGSLSDIGMCECQNNHIICEYHMLFKVNPDEDYLISSKACPVCQFKELPDYMVVTYLRTRLKMSKNDILNDIKDTFVTYDRFIKFINKCKDD